MTDGLDYQLVHTDPTPLYMGELPLRWDVVPAPVVVNLCGMYPSGDPGSRLIHGFALLDLLDEAVLPSRTDVEGFLSVVHDDVAGAPSYWHCHAGLNRSGLLLSSYLHLYRGMRISDAIALLRRERSEMVLCNHLFEGLVRSWFGDDDEQRFQRVNLAEYLREREGRN